jgi:HrpA-like RNA helicase
MRHPGYVGATFRRDSVDYLLVVAAVCAVCNGSLDVPDGAVLVFLPGVIEIRKVHRMLDTAVELRRLTAPTEVFELHGSLTPEEQVCAGARGRGGAGTRGLP